MCSTYLYAFLHINEIIQLYLEESYMSMYIYRDIKKEWERESTA